MNELEEQFIELCEEDKLDELKEFYNEHPDIDISFCNEYPFCSACKEGHLEVAKWLCTLNKNYFQYLNRIIL